MRIAYVCSDPGIPIFGCKGASIHAQAVLKVLSTQGHEIHLVTPRPGGEPRVPVIVHRLPGVSGGATAEREVSARQSDAAVTEVLTAVQPDLVYERYSLWGDAATRWAEAHGVPSVLEVNAPLVRSRPPTASWSTGRRPRQWPGARCPGRARWSASATGWLTGRVRCRRDLTGSRTLPNGVDIDRIRPADRPVTPPSGADFTVGFVGTLKPWHGLENLVAAVALPRRPSGWPVGVPTWRLLVVGDGPLREPVAQLADGLGIGGRVVCTGAVPADGVAAQLQRMDVACAPYPAQSGFYFSPLKIYEYLAAGLPVVASAVGQVPDALDHGRLGQLVPAGDVAALAEGLGAVRDDFAWRTELRRENRMAAVSRHTWTAVVERALAFAERVEAA